MPGGVPQSVAMKMIGHETESVYRRYAIGDETMLRDAAEMIAGAASVAVRWCDRDAATTTQGPRLGVHDGLRVSTLAPSVEQFYDEGGAGRAPSGDPGRKPENPACQKPLDMDRL
jgi:hypothetical protein